MGLRKVIERLRRRPTEKLDDPPSVIPRAVSADEMFQRLADTDYDLYEPKARDKE